MKDQENKRKNKRVRSSKLRGEIPEYLMSKGESKLQEIVEGLNAPYASVSKAVVDLKKQGYLASSVRGKYYVPGYEFGIPDEGQQASVVMDKVDFWQERGWKKISTYQDRATGRWFADIEFRPPRWQKYKPRV